MYAKKMSLKFNSKNDHFGRCLNFTVFEKYLYVKFADVVLNESATTHEVQSNQSGS